MISNVILLVKVQLFSFSPHTCHLEHFFTISNDNFAWQCCLFIVFLASCLELGAFTDKKRGKHRRYNCHSFYLRFCGQFYNVPCFGENSFTYLVLEKILLLKVFKRFTYNQVYMHHVTAVFFLIKLTLACASARRFWNSCSMLLISCWFFSNMDLYSSSSSFFSAAFSAIQYVTHCFTVTVEPDLWSPALSNRLSLAAR